MNDKEREKIIKKIYIVGIKKSKKIEDSGQKYNMINEDLISIINNINENFDFKEFKKDKLNEVEIVRIYLNFIISFSFLKI
jgi:hypothetical protein